MLFRMLLPLVLLVVPDSTRATVLTCTNETQVSARVNGAGVVVQSEGYSRGLPYPHNRLCRVTLISPSALQRLRLDFEDFDLEVSSHCRADSVDVSDVHAGAVHSIGVFCSSRRPRPLVSSSSVVRIVFTTDTLRSGRGFRIRVTPTRSRTVCAGHEFQCRDRTCVPGDKRCNGVFDCHDASDEDGCPSQLLLNQAECGKPPIAPRELQSDRIVGGGEALPHSWPWQVSLQEKISEPSGHFCGGTIVAREWVVAAAHCFMLAVENADDVLVKAGLHDMINPDEGHQVRRATLIISHPLFKEGQDMNYDIAVVKVAPPFNYTDKIRPACAPPQGYVVAPNTTCYATGWGSTRGSGHAYRLKQLKMIVHEFQRCKTPVVNLAGVDGDCAICASGADHVSGPCHGDSGGPLMCKDKDGDWMVYGATSMGVQVAITNSICGMGQPSLWNSVSGHSNWIRHQVATH